ncbi:hypothetical protein EJB05_13859, partial [Eragrostis curvula]
MVAVPIPSRRPANIPRRSCVPIDARHGRILLHITQPVIFGENHKNHEFEVWDPIRDQQWAVPTIKGFPNLNAAVLCAASTTVGTCDHLHCRRGPFLVVYVASTTDDGPFCVRVYSSEVGSWSEPTYAVRRPDYVGFRVPSALGGSSIYFTFLYAERIFKYSLSKQKISLVRGPPLQGGHVALVTREDGGLGLATVVDFRLYIWSRENGPRRHDRWTQIRVVELDKLLPVSAHMTFYEVVGAANCAGVIFLATGDGFYVIDLKFGRATKLCQDNFFTGIFPFTTLDNTATMTTEIIPSVVL